MRLATTGLTQRPAPPGADAVAAIEVPGPEAVSRFTWWALCCLVLLVLVPMVVARVVGRQGPRELGLRVRGTGRDAWTYLLLFAIFFPVVWLVSQREDFLRTYPFFRPPEEFGGRLARAPATRGVTSDFVLFEALYCLQFFAVEFFFRGFLVLGLKPVLGRASILVMLAPYCMIHYYKPFPEAMGSIGAGLVLGALSWRTGTVLYGWALHYAVALSMDLLALRHLGRL
jgi:hypothetical protein